MYKITIYGLYGKITKLFDNEQKAYNYGAMYICESDWSASYKVRKVNKGATL